MSENNISTRIRDLRAKHGLTLEQVAQQVGVGRSTVRKWETGIIENMRRDKIAKLATALHTTPEYLMGWSDEDKTTYAYPNTGFMISNTPQGIFKNLKILRKSRSLTPQTIASEIGISTEDYLKIEDGYNIDCMTLWWLATVFCCDMELLLSLEWQPVGGSSIPFEQSPLFRLHQAYNGLNEEDQEKVVTFAKNLKDDGNCKNIINIAARDGSFSTLTLTDKQLVKFKETIDQLPDAPDGL